MAVNCSVEGLQHWHHAAWHCDQVAVAALKLVGLYLWAKMATKQRRARACWSTEKYSRVLPPHDSNPVWLAVIHPYS